jgi:phosphoribosylformylglycinamidine (FGAM) synthase PurS component
LIFGIASTTYASPSKSVEEIKKSSRFHFEVYDENSEQYQAIIYPIREKVITNPKDKNKKLYKGRYQLAY